MTQVVIQRDEQGPCGFMVCGHADYADIGKDIVCAAISTLITTCANAIEEITGIEAVTKGSPSKACLLVVLPKGLSPAQRHDADVVLQTIQRGFRDIAAQYPKYLQIK